jgi:hypothetical protein
MGKAEAFPIVYCIFSRSSNQTRTGIIALTKLFSAEAQKNSF